ncbi:hypothetical protein ACSBR2_011761 [Camellia fascicularis]
MNSNSNGQSTFSVDGSLVQQTEPPAQRQQSSVDINTDTTIGNTQNQRPSTSHDCQTYRVRTRSWFAKTSGGDDLLKLSKTLLVTYFSAAIAMVIFRSEGSPLQSALNSKPPNGKSFGILVACIAIGFTCNMNVILLQKELPIAASIVEYAGVFSFAIGFLTMIQMILPLTLWWIVLLPGVSIFLSFLYCLTKNRVATEDVNVMFYWGDNNQVKKFCEVKKGTTLGELEAMIMPKVAPTGENVQLKFKCRIPYWQSKYEVKYDLVEIVDDDTLALVLNKSKSSWSELTLQFNVEWDESTTPVGGGGSFTQSLKTESPPPPSPSANRVVNITSSVQCTQEYFPTTL